MVLPLAALLIAAADVAGPAGSPVNLQQLFEDSCLAGEAHMAPGTVTQVSFNQMPDTLRDRLGRPAAASVWQLSDRRSYLYVLEYGPGRGVSPKICGLASQDLNLDTAIRSLDARLAGSVPPDERLTGMQWMRPEDGYVATATRAARFNVLQVNWMSDKDRAAATAELHMVRP